MRSPRPPQPLYTALLAATLTGCAVGNLGAGGLVAVLALVITLGLAACERAAIGFKPVCEGTWEPYCDQGRVEEVCCPTGEVCDYGAGMTLCDDGGCVTAPETCADSCDGEWGTVCVDGVLEAACCPSGMVCNFGMGVEYCADGSCVNAPATCPETCDGYWESYCVDGVLERACCPEGMACNYGMCTDFCSDGSCIDACLGQTCP